MARRAAGRGRGVGAVLRGGTRHRTARRRRRPEPGRRRAGRDQDRLHDGSRLPGARVRDRGGAPRSSPTRSTRSAPRSCGRTRAPRTCRRSGSPRRSACASSSGSSAPTTARPGRACDTRSGAVLSRRLGAVDGAGRLAQASARRGSRRSVASASARSARATSSSRLAGRGRRVGVLALDDLEPPPHAVELVSEPVGRVPSLRGAARAASRSRRRRATSARARRRRSPSPSSRPRIVA